VSEAAGTPDPVVTESVRNRLNGKGLRGFLSGRKAATQRTRNDAGPYPGYTANSSWALEKKKVAAFRVWATGEDLADEFQNGNDRQHQQG
jgi:hypothetical protein